MTREYRECRYSLLVFCKCILYVFGQFHRLETESVLTTLSNFNKKNLSLTCLSNVKKGENNLIFLHFNVSLLFLCSSSVHVQISMTRNRKYDESSSFRNMRIHIDSSKKSKVPNFRKYQNSINFLLASTLDVDFKLYYTGLEVK